MKPVEYYESPQVIVKSCKLSTLILQDSGQNGGTEGVNSETWYY